MGRTWRDRLLDLDRDVTPARAVARWGGDASSLRLASLRSNVVYRFGSPDQGRYLRLVHAENRSPQEVDAVVAFAAHLAARGAQVAGPIRSRGHRWVEVVEQGDQVFVASVFREVSGTALDRTCTDPTIFRAWGCALATLHNAAAAFRPADPTSFGTIHAHWARVRSRLADAEEAVLNSFDQIDGWLSTLSPADDWGLTHGDCNATNIIWDGRRASVIDFDEPLFHWFAADVARGFREFPTSHPGRGACQGAMVEGYRSRRALSSEWTSRIPWLVRMIDLDMYAWARQLAPGSVLPGGETREEGLAELERNLATPLSEIS